MEKFLIMMLNSNWIMKYDYDSAILTTIRPEVRGFKPGWKRQICKGDKNVWHDFLGKENKSGRPVS